MSIIFIASNKLTHIGQGANGKEEENEKNFVRALIRKVSFLSQTVGDKTCSGLFRLHS